MIFVNLGQIGEHKFDKFTGFHLCVTKSTVYLETIWVWEIKVTNVENYKITKSDINNYLKMLTDNFNHYHPIVIMEKLYSLCLILCSAFLELQLFEYT